MKPRRGEVWLVRFPFSDMSTTKLRPALVLAVHGHDVIFAGIHETVLVRRIGSFSPAVMRQVQRLLKLALLIP